MLEGKRSPRFAGLKPRFVHVMICDGLSASERYYGLGAGFAAAFEYLRRARRGDYAIGKTTIIPDQVSASVVSKAGRSKIDAGFEYHEQFADVHLCLNGREYIGWRGNPDGLSIRAAFRTEEDFGLYDGTPEEFVPLADDRFAVFFPGELHAPLIGDGELTKICVKVRCVPLST